MTRLLAFVLMCSFAKGALAMSFLDRSVNELYESSDLVVVGTVEEIHGKCRGKGRCWGYMIRIATDSVVKSTSIKGAKDTTNTVCSDVPLEPGRTYTLFLEKVQNNQTSEIGRCKLVLPFDGAFQERAGEIYRMGSQQGLVNIAFEGNVYWTNAILVPGFKETLARLSPALQ